MNKAAVAVEDVRSFKEMKRDPLYAARVAIHPKEISGLFRQIKWAVLATLLALYYVLPWLRWDRGPGTPDQAVLVDIPGRRFFFFGIEIWPQEIYYLTFLLIIAAFGLFLVSSLFGRVWCGFTCPQTVWTDLYMWVERKIEGDRGARIRLDRAPWTRDKIRKRASKHAVWLLIAAATGGVWIMYFNDAPTVTVDLLTGQAGLAVYFFFGLFTATTYLLAGWAREQVCTYMCPWPRFQAALLDQDSYVVTYQRWRGEPRAPLRKGTTDWSNRGDCIACNNCVAVCPMGIDIRDGLQLECIGCGLCIDACNDVMKRIDRPRDLITLSTDHNQRRLAEGLRPTRRFLRKRTLLYVAVLSLVSLVVLVALSTRASTDVNILHDRNPLFVQLADGSIRNGYTIKILNKNRTAQHYELGIEGLAGATLTVMGQDAEGIPSATLVANPDGVTTYRVFVSAPRDGLEEVQDVTFSLTDQGGDGSTTEQETVFRAPAS